jgi:hypothetical protein
MPIGFAGDETDEAIEIYPRCTADTPSKPKPGRADRPPISRPEMTKRKSPSAVALPDAEADGRTRIARRFRTLTEAFTADLGGKLSHADTALVRQAAAMTVRAEMAQAALLIGHAIDDDQLVRLSNASTRILTVIAGRQSAKHKRPMSIEDIQAVIDAAADSEEANDGDADPQ